jgi:hypothetical protein
MRRRTVFSGIGLLILLGPFSAFLHEVQKKPDAIIGKVNPPKEWKGTIRCDNGVPIIHNPDQPLYGTFAFDLEKDLVIGKESDEQEAFFSPYGIDFMVDEKGCVYVLDRDTGSCRIQKFGPDGKYLQTMGRRGQGPGEFEHPSRIEFDSYGRILVLHTDGVILEVFEPDGRFNKKIRLNKGVNSFIPTPTGGYISAITFINDVLNGDYSHAIVRMDGSGEIIETYIRQKDDGNIVIRRADGSRSFMRHHYPNLLLIRPFGNDLFGYGYSSEYKIIIRDMGGSLRREVYKEGKPVSVARKEKEAETAFWFGRNHGRISKKELENAISLPDHAPYFSGLCCDDEGRIYVRRFKAVFSNPGERLNTPADYDVFDSRGLFVYRMTLPFMSDFVIKKGFLYRITLDDESGVFQVLRCRIRNYGDMKGSR